MADTSLLVLDANGAQQNLSVGQDAANGNKLLGATQITSPTTGKKQEVSAAAAAHVNLTQVATTTLLTGAGAAAAGSPRATVAQDVTTIAGAAPGTPGTASANVVTVQGVAGMTPVQVTQAASAKFTTIGSIASGSAAADAPVLVAGSDGTNVKTFMTASAANLASSTANGSMPVTGPGTWSVKDVPAANTQASATKASGGAGVRHIARSISATLASGSTVVTVPATPVTIILRDGATGAGAIIWQQYMSVITTAGSFASIQLTGLDIVGSASNAMTLEFSAGGGAGSFESVTLTGYSVS